MEEAPPADRRGRSSQQCLRRPREKERLFVWRRRRPRPFHPFSSRLFSLSSFSFFLNPLCDIFLMAAPSLRSDPTHPPHLSSIPPARVGKETEEKKEEGEEENFCWRSTVKNKILLDPSTSFSFSSFLSLLSLSSLLLLLLPLLLGPPPLFPPKMRFNYMLG